MRNIVNWEKFLARPENPKILVDLFRLSEELTWIESIFFTIIAMESLKFSENSSHFFKFEHFRWVNEPFLYLIWLLDEYLIRWWCQTKLIRCLKTQNRNFIRSKIGRRRDLILKILHESLENGWKIEKFILPCRLLLRVRWFEILIVHFVHVIRVILSEWWLLCTPVDVFYRVVHRVCCFRESVTLHWQSSKRVDEEVVQSRREKKNEKKIERER